MSLNKYTRTITEPKSQGASQAMLKGTLFKYIKNVKTASEGCVTDE